MMCFYTCVHCGRALDRALLNPWLSSLAGAVYECHAPRCAEGEAWYRENTWRTVAGVVLRDEREDAVREQRTAIVANGGRLCRTHSRLS